MKDKLELFRKTIASRRKELKLSQKEAAKMIGISTLSLMKYENGQMKPSLLVAMEICSAYELDLNYCVYGNEPLHALIDLRTKASWLALMFMDNDVLVTQTGEVRLKNMNLSIFLKGLEFLRDMDGMTLMEKIETLQNVLKKL